MSSFGKSFGPEMFGKQPIQKAKSPIWKGPEKDGITFSLLSRWLVCKERFKLLVVEGLRPVESFNHRIEYGNMWHACEEAFAAKEDWRPKLLDYAKGLARKYPVSGDDISKWHDICRLQFPLYVGHWAKNREVLERTPLLQEQTFDVPYGLPSGRTVRLRGKWDSVDLIGKGKVAGIYIQENKTKGEIDEGKVKRQLTFDLQTMMYLVALHEHNKNVREHIPLLRPTAALAAYVQFPILGVRYNVVRRPLSGGKGSIVQHKPSKSNPAGESKQEYYRRLAAYIEAEPSSYFMRWKVEINSADVALFRRTCLDPILENLCWWYEEVNGLDHHYPFPPTHWRHPFGCFSIMDSGGSHDLDEHLATGSMAGLTRIDNLFPELT